MSRAASISLLLATLVAICILSLKRVSSQSSLRRITNTSDEGISLNPSVSGDGKIIAFESTEDIAGAGGTDHFRAIRANISAEPATFFQMGGTRAVAPATSQDGSRIAFASKDDPLDTNPDGNSEIFLFDGAKLIQVTNTSPGDPADRIAHGNFQPSISDDGRYVAFSSNRNLAGQNADANLEIFIYDVVDATFVQLTNSRGIVGFSDAKISGDGRSIAYARDPETTASSNLDLLEQGRVGSAVTILAAAVPKLAMTYGRAISDDGARIVYSSETGTNTSQVFMYDGRNGGIVREITALGARSTDVPLHPTISGDGLRVAFATRRNVIGTNTGGGVQLYVYDIPSGITSRITNAPSTATAGVVSSLNDDGSIVVFNFPRVLSGAVTNTDSANNSEIYATATPARPATGTLSAILNGASFGNEPSPTKAVAPNSIAIARGMPLANITKQPQRSADGTFPTSVAGTRVMVNGRLAQIFFVSPSQVNFLVPPQTEIGDAQVVVINSDGFSSAGMVAILPTAPGIFTKSGDGTGEGVILDSDTLQEGPFDPTRGNLRLTIFTTGARSASQTLVVTGGRTINAETVIPSPEMSGLDEVHALIPADLRGAGTVRIFLQSDGRASNSATVTFTGEAIRDIVINELLADPPPGSGGDANHDGARDGAQDEFVELVNTTAHDIDISNYQLSTHNSDSVKDSPRHKFAPPTILPACTAIVIFGGGNPDPNEPIFAGAQIVRASSGGLSLTNSGAVITLTDAANQIVTFVEYGGSTGLNGNSGQSLTRSPDINGSFVLHQAAANSGSKLFSPGTRSDGAGFVACPPVARVGVEPAAATIEPGRQQLFMARAFDSNDQELSGVIFKWSSSNTAVVTVDGNGVATGIGTGTSEIRASARGTQSPASIVTVGAAAPTPTPLVVISQVFGGGGNSGAPFKNDFIELFNRGNTDVNIAGWSIQHTSASGITWNVTALCPSGTCGLAAGKYFLIQEGSAGTNGTDLPMPDTIGSVNLASTSGKIALVTNTTALSGAGCPFASGVVDFVGYGTTADCFEGSNHAPAPGNTTSDLRAGNGCIDTNNNTTDFSIGAPNPRNSSSALNDCTASPTPTPLPTLTPTPPPTPTPIATPSPSPTATPATTPNPLIVISQVYGGGGNSNALFNNDFIELFNRGTESIDVTGWSVQTAAAAGASWTVARLCASGSCMIAPGRYFLLQLGSGGTNGNDLPTPDAAGSANLSATAAKVALVSSTTALTGSGCPFSSTTIDFIGYGATADCFEGSNHAPGPSNTTADLRAGSGCIDTNDNGSDFSTGAPNPRNSSSTLNDCSAPAATPTPTPTPTVTPTPTPTPLLTPTPIVTPTPSATPIDSPTPTPTPTPIPTSTPTASPLPITKVVISQIYGGGGNTGAPYSHDFIEIFNAGNQPVSLAGWSVQYAPATSTSWTVTALTSVTLQPGQYYLIQQASGGINGIPPPLPDATGTINMAATGGKVALVNKTMALSGTGCPFVAGVVDFLGYGSTADCREGASPANNAPAPSNTTADLRVGAGCMDTDVNSADYSMGAPNPRNTGSGINQCPATFAPTNGTHELAWLDALDIGIAITLAGW